LLLFSVDNAERSCERTRWQECALLTDRFDDEIDSGLAAQRSLIDESTFSRMIAD